MSNKIYKIATGKSRKETSWINEELSWDELKERMAKIIFTQENQSEYFKMDATRQSEIKDVGGFVGGWTYKGQRGKGKIKLRSLITLDADHLKKKQLDEIIESWEFTCGNQAYIYSTHKHTEAEPRVRFVIPLEENITEEEYEFVARVIASRIDPTLEIFDDTTYEASRLMFWPSTSQGAAYINQSLGDADAKPVDAELILSDDPRAGDTSRWPRSSREKEPRPYDTKRVQDPLEKNGLIGAFCRAYPMHEAILEFLPAFYYEGTAGRYTYAESKSADGLVIYDDKFAYSHHETDPASHMLLNAFDLVRIHLFANKDTPEHLKLPVSQRPSYKAMKRMLKEYPEVMAELDAEAELIKNERKENRKDAIPDEVKSDPTKAWMKELEYYFNEWEGNQIKSTRDNLKIIFKNDPNLKGIVAMDEFKQRLLKTRAPIWPSSSNPYWSDTDDAGLRLYLESTYNIEGKQKIDDVVVLIAQQNSFNPVKEFIETAEWDRVPRVESLFIDYLGAANNSYTKAMTRKFMVAAVKRVYEPGCKYDYMIMLHGEQGIGKSLLVSKLGSKWFSDTMPDVRSQKAYEAVDGQWIIEFGELAGLRKSDRDSIKVFVSKQEDTYRKAYGHHVTTNLRSCVFIGTTNDDDFLNDPTGARRFLVIPCNPKKRTKTVWGDLSDGVISQVWAEAKVYYEQGENIMHFEDSIKDEAQKMQEEYTEQNEKAGIIEMYTEMEVPQNWYELPKEQRRDFTQGNETYRQEAIIKAGGSIKRERFSAIEILYECIGIELKNITRLQSIEMRNILKTLGWESMKSPGKDKAYGSIRQFSRKEKKHESV